MPDEGDLAGWYDLTGGVDGVQAGQGLCVGQDEAVDGDAVLVDAQGVAGDGGDLFEEGIDAAAFPAGGEMACQVVVLNEVRWRTDHDILPGGGGGVVDAPKPAGHAGGHIDAQAGEVQGKANRDENGKGRPQRGGNGAVSRCDRIHRVLRVLLVGRGWGLGNGVFGRREWGVRRRP